MVNSRLDPYRDEILQMVRDRRTQAQILQHLATAYGVTIQKSTLSEYLKRQTNVVAATTPRVSPEEEHFLSQAEVYGELQVSAQALLDKMNDVIAVLRETGGAVYTLATDTERRDSALQTGFQQLHQMLASLSQRTGSSANAPNPPNMPNIPNLPNTPNLPSEHPPTVPRALVLKIWKRALLITGGFWLIVYLLLRGYVFGS